MTGEAEVAQTWSALLDAPTRRAYIQAQYAHAESGDDLIQALKAEVSNHLRTHLDYGVCLATELVALLEGCSNPLHCGWALMALSNARMEQGDYESALAALAEARQNCLRAQAPVEAARTAISGVRCLSYCGRYREASQMAEEASQVFTQHHAWGLLMKLEQNVSDLWRRQGRYVEALAALDRAAQAAQRTQEDLPLHMLEQTRGITLRFLGRYREALQAMQAARAESERRKHLLSIARCDQAMGMTYYLMGQYHQALLLLDRARTAFQQAASAGPNVLEVELLRAEALLSLNRHLQVREICDQILEPLAQRDMHYEVAWARYLAGIAALRMGDLDHAAVCLDQAREYFTTLAATDRLAELDLITAELAMIRNDATVALAFAEQGRAAFEKLEHRINAERGRLLVARAYQAAGLCDQAEQAYRQTLAVAEADDIPWLAYPCHFYLARLQHAANASDEAVISYEAALAQIERLRGTVVVEQRSYFLEDKAEPYGELVRLYLERGEDEKAWYTAERAKSRALVELLAGGVNLSAYEDEATTQLSARLADLQARYRVLHRLLTQPLRKRDEDVPQATAAQLQIELRGCERQIAEVSERLHLYSQAGTAEITASKVTVVNPTAALEADEQIVEYFATGEHFVAFILSKGQAVQAVQLPATTGKIDNQLRALRLNFARAATGRTPQLNQTRTLFSALYETLWRPLLPYLVQGNRITIVPHGALHYLPFHAFYDGGRYLIEKHELSYLPCSSLLPWCRRPLEHSARGAVALGNTLGGQLPYTTDEARQVAAVLGGQHWCDDEATLDRLQGVTAYARVLHIACHGEFRADAPLFSTLYLADGPLTTAQIFNLRVVADLVTLSACESGNSVIGGGDELIGFTRAWLYAGARTLVSTLWRVSDLATAHLMSEFYTQLSQGTRRSAALRQAQLKLLHGEQDLWKHPYFWSPFYLTGDNRALHVHTKESSL